MNNYYVHLPGIQFTPFNESSKISVLIGGNNPMLHMYNDPCVGKEKELVPLKTKLGWVIFVGNKNKKTSSANAFSKEFNLAQVVSEFWKIEWNGVSEKQCSSILPKTGQQVLIILQETTVNKNSQYAVGLFWDSDNILQTNYKNIALSQLFSP